MPPLRLFRRSSALLATLAFLAALDGCSKRDSAVAIGDRDQIIHIGNLVEPSDLDPQIEDDQQTANVIMAFFEGLTQYDARNNDPVPAVAERWEVSADNLTWTFHLRANAKWSNGDPVTAHDFVFAYERMLSPNLAAEYASMLFVLKNGKAFYDRKVTDFAQVGVRAVDDHTLALTLEQPVPYLPAMTCHPSWYPLHRASMEKFGRIDQRGNAWTRPGNLVGNGYFTLTEWKPRQYVHGVKNENYWDRDNVKLKEVYFYPIESEDSEERSFRAGQLHVTSTLPISKVAVYEKEKSEFYHPHAFLGTFFLRFNTTKPPLGDARVRRALSLAIDRERFVRDVMRGHQQAGGHLAPPDLAGFTSTTNVTYDLPTAKKLLADAGFPDGRGFPHLEILYNTTEANRLICEALQQMWRTGLGIDIGLLNQESKVQTDSMRRLDYEIGRYAWIGDYMDPSTFFDLMMSDNGNNETGWKNAEYDRLVTEADHAPDVARRYALYQRCEQILAEEAPIAPIYFYTRNNLVRPEVKGWYGTLLDFHPLKGVWLDPAAAK
ncbi:MAG TPA: peptide ABC transporter substrate-binding protein [Opitutaceae bacterium]|nr:peptide ABC transporter substrate-binding protein [Opitutaceae bacterium]